MADPVTASLAIAGMGFSALGALTQAQGAEYTGAAQAQQATYQAGVAQLNKQIADQNAEYALKVAPVQAQESGMATRFQVGQTKAIQGAGGLDVNTGTGTNVRESEVEVGRFNQAIIRSNAARVAYGYEVQASGEEAQAGLYKMAATTAPQAAAISAQASLLGGAGSVSTKWMQAQQQGIFS